MIGLLVLGGAAAYVAIFWFVIAKARNRGERISAIVVALLIPFWDLPFGYANFYRHCSNEGGVRVSKNLQANTILVDQSAGYTPEEILKLGFKSVEYLATDKVIRYEPALKGVTKSTHPSPLSTLRVHSPGSKPLSWNLIRHDYFVSQIDGGQVVASQTDFEWRGMWWQVSGAPLFGHGGFCLGVNDRPMLSLVAGVK